MLFVPSVWFLQRLPSRAEPWMKDTELFLKDGGTKAGHLPAEEGMAKAFPAVGIDRSKLI